MIQQLYDNDKIMTIIIIIKTTDENSPKVYLSISVSMSLSNMYIYIYIHFFTDTSQDPSISIDGARKRGQKKKAHDRKEDQQI